MTTGHTHHLIRCRRDGILDLLLRTPTLYTSRDLDRVDASRFVYGPVEGEPGLYRLSPLGALHGLTGATLEVYGPGEAGLRRDRVRARLSTLLARATRRILR